MVHRAEPNSPAQLASKAVSEREPEPEPNSDTLRLRLDSHSQRAISGKTVNITIQNNGCADEVITNIALSWPQGTNGNLEKIKLDGDTLWTGAAGSPINFGVPPLDGQCGQANYTKKKSSDVLIFQFHNNAAPLNNAAYSGSAMFQSQCQLKLRLANAVNSENTAANA